MRINFLIIMFLLCISSYLNAKQKSSTKENFTTFLSDFSTSPEFQKQRISDKFIECEISIEGDSTCERIASNNWKYTQLIASNYLQQIYTSFDLKIKDSNERVFAIERIEGGSATYYFFKREKGNWYLIKRLIYL